MKIKDIFITGSKISNDSAWLNIQIKYKDITIHGIIYQKTSATDIELLFNNIYFVGGSASSNEIGAVINFINKNKTGAYKILSEQYL